jgi:hypothetical protein
MSRRATPIGIAVVVMILAVVASSSGTARLWDSPPMNRDRSIDPIEVVDDDEQNAPSESDEDLPDPADHWLVQLFAVVVSGAVLVAALAVVASWWPPTWLVRRRRRSGEMGEALGDDAAAVVRVDGVAARRALAEGTPRNAIVACWMQLERDASSAGLARREAETSAEYVERVVEASSVDPTPIRDLSALFREARFSDHALGEEHRLRAIAALERVESALRQHEQATT